MKLQSLFLTIVLATSSCTAPDDIQNSQAISLACKELPRGAISPVNAWVRPAPEGRATSAAYLTLCNQSSQQKTLVRVESSIATNVELHETTRDRDGIASMAPLDQIQIAPGDASELKPGGAHIMLIGLNQPIITGDNITLTLHFENGQSVTVDAEARNPEATASRTHH